MSSFILLLIWKYLSHKKELLRNWYMRSLVLDWIMECLSSMIYLIIRLKGSREYITRLLGSLLRAENMIITPILKDLHWLPVRQSIMFEIVTLTYHYTNGLEPYLSQLLVPYSPSCSLRSSVSYILKEHRTRTKLYAHSALMNGAPGLWTRYVLPFDKVMHPLLLNWALKSAYFRRVSCSNEHVVDICAI